MTHPAYHLVRPAEHDALPILVDSPHSGTEYPDDFGAVVDAAGRHYAEDGFVDQLYRNAPRAGATLLAARFPRLYIDPNRSTDDIDEDVLAEPWPEPIAPSPMSRLGMGLIWRRSNGRDVYDRRLGVAEIQRRIAGYWQTYHDALWSAADAAHRRFGALWHLDVHSMGDDSYPMLGLPDRPLADFVLADCAGDRTTADAATVAVVERALLDHGFSVARNDPFSAGEIVRRSGRPAARRHALMIEVKMSCYMDIASHRVHDGFARVQRALDAMLAALAAHVRSEL